jgi:hypothetical protein
MACPVMPATGCRLLVWHGDGDEIGIGIEYRIIII